MVKSASAWKAFLSLLCVALGWMFLVHAHSDHVDYNTYHWAGRMVLEGRFAELYAPERASMGGFLYPLISALFFAPFAALGEVAGRWAFYLVLAGCLIGALRWVRRVYPGNETAALALTLLLGARSINDSFISGNINLLLFGLGVFAFRYREERPLVAEGALSLAMSFKVFPALLVALWLGERRWGALVRLAFFTVALYVVPYLFLGWDEGWRMLGAWLQTLQSPGNFGGRDFLMFQNLPAAFHRLAEAWGMTHAWVLPMTAFIGIIVAFLALIASRKNPTRTYVMLLAWVPLLSPVTWYGLGVFYLPLIYLTVTRALGERRIGDSLRLALFFVLYTLMGKDVIGGPAFDWISGHSVPLIGVLVLVLSEVMSVLRKVRENTIEMHSMKR